MGIITNKNCGRIVLFRGLLECLLVDEGNEAEKYIFGLCFPISPADTGRPHREPEMGGRAGADERGRQEAGAGVGPQGALLNWQEDEREMKITRASSSFATDAPKNWVNW